MASENFARGTKRHLSGDQPESSPKRRALDPLALREEKRVALLSAYQKLTPPPENPDPRLRRFPASQRPERLLRNFLMARRMRAELMEELSEAMFTDPGRMTKKWEWEFAMSVNQSFGTVAQLANADEVVVCFSPLFRTEISLLADNSDVVQVEPQQQQEDEAPQLPAEVFSELEKFFDHFDIPEF